jgi:hypothetical protein
VGCVAILSSPALVQAELRIRERLGNRDAQRLEARRPDRDEERGYRLHPAGEIGETRRDQIAAGQLGVVDCGTRLGQSDLRR